MTCSPSIPFRSAARTPLTPLLLVVLVAVVWSCYLLGLNSDLDFNWRRLVEFVSYAFRPALTYQSPMVPEGTPPLWLRLIEACATTVLFASAGTGVALFLGIPLALCGSSWILFGDYDRSLASRAIRSLIYIGARLLATLIRSVHELLWAVLFLAAFGLSDYTAVLAIGIPYAGVFARVFADLIDEAPRSPGSALRDLGANRLLVFVFGIVPLALPNMVSYALYRFECAVRSSAILGFFGIPTLGYFISNAFENLYYREVWTYLFTLFLLIFLFDRLSYVLRRGVSA